MLYQLSYTRMAERGGFEPPVGHYPHDGLANRCLKPLSHRSVVAPQGFEPCQTDSKSVVLPLQHYGALNHK
tara:strand:- start:6852 stop:7064 length:213 start_codon:yes stop_codon:yes gene_type:complete